MKSYDIVRMEGISAVFSNKLGYKKIIGSSEIKVSDAPINNSKDRYILISGDENSLRKAMKDNMCIGVSIKDNTLMKKSLEQLHDSEKLLFINGSLITSSRKNELPKVVYKARNLIRNAVIYKTNTSFVSLANDYAHIMSAMQLKAVAMFICEDERLTNRLLASFDWDDYK